MRQARVGVNLIGSIICIEFDYKHGPLTFVMNELWFALGFGQVELAHSTSQASNPASSLVHNARLASSPAAILDAIPDAGASSLTRWATFACPRLYLPNWHLLLQLLWLLILLPVHTGFDWQRLCRNVNLRAHYVFELGYLLSGFIEDKGFTGLAKCDLIASKIVWSTWRLLTSSKSFSHMTLREGLFVSSAHGIVVSKRILR